MRARKPRSWTVIGLPARISLSNWFLIHGFADDRFWHPCAYAGDRSQRMRLIFWTSLGVLLHTYLAYPLLLAAIGCVKQLKSDLGFGFNRRTRRTGNDETARPLVSIVFAAHDEEAVIARKMSNCGSLSYP